MGWFDKDDNGLFGGLFDFNGDGETTLDEEYIGFNIFKECMKEESSDIFDSDDYDMYEWRDHCEDGMEYGVDPEDYETEEEYQEALGEEKYGWRDCCEDGMEYGVDSEDYETEEEYQEALNEMKYSWREYCEDGMEYGVDPEDYETEEEYQEALNEMRYGWRDHCKDGMGYGVDLEDYETEEEYRTALDAVVRQEKCERKRKGERDLRARSQVYLKDKTIYIYCGIELPGSSHIYSYRTEDHSIQIGDRVIVPVGKDNLETEGMVVCTGMYLRKAVPYPVEMTKTIIRKVTEGI